MGKVLAASVIDDVRAYLELVQVGVGTKGGAEAVVHVVRQWLGRNLNDTDRVLGMLDFSNAFNCVDRSAFREAVRRVVPSLAPWVDFCYGQDSPLLLGQHSLKSTRGIQQGDPLGPALFALAIHEIVMQTGREVQQRFPDELDFAAFYLDDGVLGGTARAVRCFCDQLMEALSNVGLEMQKAKCEIVPACTNSGTAAKEAFQGFKYNSSGDFKLLGAPFGTPEFCTEHTRKRRRFQACQTHRVPCIYSGNALRFASLRIRPAQFRPPFMQMHWQSSLEISERHSQRSLEQM